MVTRRRHWESIYRTKAEGELSWHQNEPTLPLRLIQDVAKPESRIVDIGGGAAQLAARLWDGGFRRVSVLDIAHAAIRASQARTGIHERGIHWIRADVTKVDRLGQFDVWHDRAVFHFLTDPSDRRAYVALARRTIPVGGHVILATFAMGGPEQCSGLDVVRYDGRKLAGEFSPGFSILKEVGENHRTPWGARQPFTYVVLRRVRLGSRRAPPVSRASVQGLGPEPPR